MIVWPVISSRRDHREQQDRADRGRPIPHHAQRGQDDQDDQQDDLEAEASEARAALGIEILALVLDGAGGPGSARRGRVGGRRDGASGSVEVTRGNDTDPERFALVPAVHGAPRRYARAPGARRATSAPTPGSGRRLLSAGRGSVARPSTTSALGRASRSAGARMTFHDREPPPTTIRSRVMTLASIQIGSVGGQPEHGHAADLHARDLPRRARTARTTPCACRAGRERPGSRPDGSAPGRRRRRTAAARPCR